MVAVTLWDLGSMSEVEVAVLSRLSFEAVAKPVPSFVGGVQRLQIDVPLLVTGLASAAFVILFYAGVLLWHRNSSVKAECIDLDLTSPSVHSRLWVYELTCAALGRFSSTRKRSRRRRETTSINGGTSNINVDLKERYKSSNADENQLAIRDVTQGECDPHQLHMAGCTVPRVYHIGSAHLGRPMEDEPLEEIMRKLKLNMLYDVYAV